MYVGLAGTTENHVTGLQISSWVLVMWKVIFWWSRFVTSLGIDKSLMNERNPGIPIHRSIIMHASRCVRLPMYCLRLQVLRSRKAGLYPYACWSHGST